jgi:hypothetical protein
MRKIVSGLLVSLDGVVESPERWNTPYFNDDIGGELGSQMAAADTMLLGRVTYEEFAAYWADKGSDVPFADAINGIPKLVASTTLHKADWQNTTLINGNLVDRLTELKQQPGARTSLPAAARHSSARCCTPVSWTSCGCSSTPWSSGRGGACSRTASSRCHLSC